MPIVQSLLYARINLERSPSLLSSDQRVPDPPLTFQRLCAERPDTPTGPTHTSTWNHSFISQARVELLCFRQVLEMRVSKIDMILPS